MKSQFNRQSKPIPRHHFLILAIIFLSIPITFLVFSCNSAFGGESFATGCRKAGFEKANKGFKSVYKESELHETIELVNVTVHIVGNRDKFKFKKAAAYGSPIQGYATRKNEIWIFGTVVNGRIVLNQAILGHELNHLLQFNHPQVHNPDKLDDIGM